MSKLHPLLDDYVANPEVHRFRKRFTGEEFYLADHRINGATILPGVAYLEMARAAGTLAQSKQVVTSLSNII